MFGCVELQHESTSQQIRSDFVKNDLAPKGPFRLPVGFYPLNFHVRLG